MTRVLDPSAAIYQLHADLGLQRWIRGEAQVRLSIVSSHLQQTIWTHVDSLHVVSEKFLDLLALYRGMYNNIVAFFPVLRTKSATLPGLFTHSWSCDPILVSKL